LLKRRLKHPMQRNHPPANDGQYLYPSIKLKGPYHEFGAVHGPICVCMFAFSVFVYDLYVKSPLCDSFHDNPNQGTDLFQTSGVCLHGCCVQDEAQLKVVFLKYRLLVAQSKS